MTAPAAETGPDGLPLVADQAPVLDVVIPVHNEEAALASSVARVHRHLSRLPYSFRITVADNASTDGTALVAHRLSHEYDEVRAVHLQQKGRGRALKEVWSRSGSQVLVYMDVDLSTDLNALLPLVAPLLSGHSDLAIGTRLTRGSASTLLRTEAGRVPMLNSIPNAFSNVPASKSKLLVRNSLGFTRLPGGR